MLSEVLSAEDRARLQQGDESLFNRLLYENLKRGRSRGYKLTAVRSPQEQSQPEERSPPVEESQQSPGGG